MKEPITKFDLEAAFKALDDLGAPRASKGLKANRPALTEIFSRKTGFDALIEEYYDVNDTAELNDAQEAREAEIAKAKLARIEKIVDLDAESPDDLLASYVGKYIMQCPQCMTLFYKNQEDIEKSEEDPSTVNINEVCQHCGNDSGYTLIGKVGEAEAEAEEAQANEDSDLNLDVEEEPVEDEAPAETDEAGGGESEEDFDLAALDDIDLDEEPTTTEESHQFNREGTLLVEDLDDTLTEAAAVDISEAEFKELINTPEFKTPISDSSVRAMLNSMKDDEEDEEDATKNESVQESVTVNNIELKYAVLNADGTYAGEPCATEEAARELASHQEGRIIVTLDEADIALLKEGTFSLLGKSIKKRAKSTGKNIKDKFRAGVEKFAAKSASREEKANWVLNNALIDYSTISIDEDGLMTPDAQNQRFKVFIVLGFKGKYKNDRDIKMVPSYDNDALVLGMKVQERTEYAEADSLAKGWSMKEGNGPAFIYLAKDKNDTKAAFLCQYFRGELKKDNLEGYVQTVKNQLLSSKQLEDGGFDEMDVEMDDTNESLNTLMANLTDLHESSIEACITNALTEAYANVKDYKLTACTYYKDKLTVDGVISFKSGNTRNSAYVFTEAKLSDKTVALKGINEKLGLDKRFVITGTVDNTNTFIAESFTAHKIN